MHEIYFDNVDIFSWSSWSIQILSIKMTDVVDECWIQCLNLMNNEHSNGENDRERAKSSNNRFCSINNFHRWREGKKRWRMIIEGYQSNWLTITDLRTNKTSGHMQMNQLDAQISSIVLRIKSHLNRRSISVTSFRWKLISFHTITTNIDCGRCISFLG